MRNCSENTEVSIYYHVPEKKNKQKTLKITIMMIMKTIHHYHYHHHHPHVRSWNVRHYLIQTISRTHHQAHLRIGQRPSYFTGVLKQGWVLHVQRGGVR